MYKCADCGAKRPDLKSLVMHDCPESPANVMDCGECGNRLDPLHSFVCCTCNTKLAHLMLLNREGARGLHELLMNAFKPDGLAEDIRDALIREEIKRRQEK